MSKVLLVEDDNNLREIYEARLQAEGYEIRSAEDGEQALVVAKEFKPELIISDVMMPKISGFEMLDILHNTDGLKNTRVIMLTALGQAEDKKRADSLGADLYLVKSQVTLEDIVKAAQDVLGKGDEATSPPVPAVADLPAPELTTAPELPSEEPATSTELPAPELVTAPQDVNATETAEVPEVPEQTAQSVEEPIPSEATDEVSNTSDTTSAAETEPAVPADVQTPSEPETPEATAEPSAPVITPAYDANIGSPSSTNNDAAASDPVTTDDTAEPAVVPDPSTAEPTTEGPTSSEFGSAASEKATINQQIEDFIAHTPDTPPPVAEPSEEVTTDEAATDDATETANDEVMADAVESLNKESDVPSESAPEPDTEEEKPPVAEAEDTPPPNNGSVTIAKKKIIKPIESAPKPSLDELLAKEESKAPPAAAAPIISDIAKAPIAEPSAPATEQPAVAELVQPAPEVQPAPADPNKSDDFDPHNVAL